MSPRICTSGISSGVIFSTPPAFSMSEVSFATALSSSSFASTRVMFQYTAHLPSDSVVIDSDTFSGFVVVGSNATRSEEHTSELQSLMRISYAVFCLKKKNTYYNDNINQLQHQNRSQLIAIILS